MVDPSRAADVATAVASIDTVCQRFAALLDDLRVTATASARVTPAAQFARLPSERSGQAGNWAYPRSGTTCPLTPAEVDAAVDLAQHQLRGVAELLPAWQIETEADIRAGKSRGGTDTPLAALARADDRMDQIRNGVSILRSPYAGLYLPVGDDYADADWTDNYDDLSLAAVQLGVALLKLALGDPRAALGEAKEAWTLLA
ncbi:hypothetical protein [Kitasatospora kifunensis]|uniref:Uncharacterized protein n=1 Tax=Kitasatospora kifunensis TaxID=58351 RepID=A0A7W7RBW4_KITKI|nr:hypothetical protein [Kitasatospora kifunensis]MBB4929118.1 hypothetical protein [Kitasatospora kifunensis]